MKYEAEEYRGIKTEWYSGERNSDYEIVSAVIKGQILTKQKELDQKKFKSCNHRKGGTCEYVPGIGHTGRISLGSTPNDYSVIKHQFAWGDIWVICTRCNFKWKPGVPGYEEALLFPTRNRMSTAIQIALPKEKLEEARELTRGS